VDQHSRAFIGIDTSKLRNAVAVAEEGRDGEVRYLGEIDTAEAATRKLVVKLAAKYRQLTFCYEAGPTGYGLHRKAASCGRVAWSPCGPGAPQADLQRMKRCYSAAASSAPRSLSAWCN
jgi:hypothetical protein